MRVLLFLFLFLLPVTAVAKPVVLVSIPPQAYFVERLAGDFVETTVLVQQGGDPHSYEPGVSTMTRVTRAQLYFTIGLPFEKQWLPRFQDMRKDLHVLQPKALYVMVPEYAISEGGDDPHIWMAPSAMLSVLPELANALGSIVPEHSVEMWENKAALEAELYALEKDIRAVFADIPPEARAFLSVHQAWDHYAEDFGLRAHSVEQEGKEAGPRAMAEAVGLARREGIRVVVTTPDGQRSAAEALAADIHGVLVDVDPLAADWAENLRRFSRALAQAMAETAPLNLRQRR